MSIGELPDLRRVGIIAIDVETKDEGLAADIGPGWPWNGGHICGVAVAYRVESEVRAHYIPLRHPDDENVDREQFTRWLRDLFASSVSVITQNGLYDYGWMRADLGITMPPAERMEEIGALATMVDENRRSYKLDDLCRWRGVPGKDEAALMAGCAALGLIPKGRKKFNPQAHIWQLPARIVEPYARQDAVSTLLLFESLDPVLDVEDTRRAYRLECDLLPMVHAMRWRGIRVDIPAAERGRDLLLGKRDAVFAELSDKLGASVGMAEIGRTRWLAPTFDAHGVAYPRTEKGNPSFTAGNTGWMPRHPHWLPQLIIRADKYNKAAAFVANVLAHTMRGRVHADIHPHRDGQGGARTLRFSYSNPPLQQTPAHDEELAPLIRGVFLPEEGEVWAKCDLSQQEFRIGVHYAVRHGLLKAREVAERYRDNPATDIHLLVAEWTGFERQSAKNVNYGKSYRMGPRGFARRYGITESEARAIYARYDRELPFVSMLAQLCERVAHRDGHFKLFNGARLHCNLWVSPGKWAKGAGPCERAEAERRVRDPGHPWYGQRLRRADTYKAINTLIQSAAAIYTKLWMVKAYREGFIPPLQMHDALELSVSSPEQAEMVARLGEEVGKTIGLAVPMVVDVKFGRTWGDAKHPWSELFAETSPHVEPIEELPDGQSRARCESPIFSNDSDGAPDLAARAAADDAAAIAASIDAGDGDHFGDHFADEDHADDAADVEEVPAPIAAAAINPQSPLFQSQSPPQSPPPGQSPPQSPPSGPPSGNGRGDGFDGFTSRVDRGEKRWTGGSKTEAERDTYAEQHADEPFAAAHNRLLWKGYRFVRTFDKYTLADGALLYWQSRYELPEGIKPTKEKPRKCFVPHRMVDGQDVVGAGDRRVIYNWPAIMRASPGSTVLVAEGENKAEVLINAGLLATTVLSHKWAPECVAALTGQHLIILADHDDQGRALAADAQRKLAPVAASIRIVPAPHLWKHLPPGARDIAPGDDVVDWIKLGGDPGKLLDICREIPAEGVITASPYQFPVEADIPPWQWLYGQHLLRGEVSITAATGGTGKSTSSIVEALAEASGRPLLGLDVAEPRRVGLINLEDTRDTMSKRIAAAMRHYGLTPADVGDRLIVLGKGEVRIKIARQLRSGDVERDVTTIRALTKLATDYALDVLSIDSLIRTHKVNENDNSAMQEVIECFEEVAQRAACAVHLWHHNRKLGGERATVEAARGASAIMDACRSGRVFETMSAKEHEQLSGIDPDMRPPGFYFRAYNGKRSFAPPVEASDWFKIESVTLANGDDVGVVTRWVYPASQAAVAPEIAEVIIAEIDRGMPNGQRFSNDNAATKRAAWPIVQRRCPDKTEDQCRKIVAGWIAKKLLYEDEYQDPVYGKPRKGLYARKPTTEETQR